MSGVLRLVDGSLVYLCPTVLSCQTQVGVFLARGDEHMFLESDVEGSISIENGRRVAQSGFGQLEGEDIFSRPDLGKSVFGWDCLAEVDGLDHHLELNRGRRGVDLGCGYGRLMLPLVQRGHVLDGIDGNLMAIQHLAPRIDVRTGCRVMRADITDYTAPDTYSFAYSAMNTVRYLETRWAIRRHLRSVHNSLKSGGLYLFSVSLTPDPWTPHQVNWTVPWNGTELIVRWSREKFCHLSHQITDLIEIADRADGSVVVRERQTQASLTWPLIRQFMETSHSRFEIEGVYDQHFNATSVYDEMRGTVWVKLRKSSLGSVISREE
jgi:SAM-dependent methyltransferase